ncbi:MAG: YfiR family protein [Deltaproteobacteria bacterium]|nr:YfiR family protein [Deltaproteobacteria bacterium]MBW2447484.1 YfiR family protein [Deltaproteobacteria bacterium]
MGWVSKTDRVGPGRNTDEAFPARPRRRRHVALVALLAFAAHLPAPPVAASVAGEYSLKAAFLYQFTKYVAWPSEPDGPVDICVLGADPFGRALDEALANKKAKGQAVVARRVDSASAGAGCRILFLSRSEQPRLDAALAALGTRPTLTVADMAGFPQRGGMINLRLEDERIKLVVNPDNAARAGLKIRSELLRLAEVVRN